MKRMRRWGRPVIAGVIMSTLGFMLTGLSSAATFTSYQEAEEGALGGPAASVTDTQASGGQAVKFGPVSGFNHPGIYTSKQQLDFVKAKLTANAEPWKTAFDRTSASRYAASTWTAQPVASVECGNGGSPRNIGCTAQLDDAAAAYTQALLWYYTGNQAYANKTIQILNAWSATQTAQPWDGTATYGNNKLQAGWSASNFIRAAEIIRYSNAGWQTADISRFEDMLTDIYLPLTINGWTGGAFNWLALFADVTMDIGIFTDDQATYVNGLGDWRRTVSSHVYMSSDGPQPTVPAELTGASKDPTVYWQTSSFNDGQTQESCRDINHTAMGIASLVYAAETARIQGTDLYGEQSQRLRAMLEFHSQNIVYRQTKDDNPSFQIPSNICGGNLVWGGLLYKATGEVALNNYAGRRQQSLPKLESFVIANRPIGPSNNLHMLWETLTHANSAAAD